MSTPNLLPDTASQRAKEMLNGRAFGIAEPLDFKNPGDYVVGAVLARRELKLHYGRKGESGTALTLRVEEGASGGKPLAAGTRVVVTCERRHLLDMVARFDPQENDVVAILHHGRAANRQVAFTYSVEKTKTASLQPWDKT